MTSFFRSPWFVVAVAALGYFVDAYDLIIFSVVRIASLRELGVSNERLLDVGLLLLDVQVGGLLVGGVLWGVLGDKRGRRSVLFASIFLYSVANAANAFVDTVEAYAAWRFVAGVGLAGELGAGVTLVSEILGPDVRGFGTTIIATTGVVGVVVAALVGETLPWRTAYIVGGVMGLALLLLRAGTRESAMFERIAKTSVRRGRFWTLVASRKARRTYVCVTLVGVPVWFVIGILLTFAPELGRTMGMSVAPVPSRAVFWFYLGFTAGDLTTGLLSQWLGSRKKVLFAFLALTALLMAAYFEVAPSSPRVFYAVLSALGFSTGYWAVFVTVISEQFGTNLRATATTTVPNLVRASVLPLTALLQWWRSSFGLIPSTMTMGVVVLIAAAFATRALDESYGRDLDFVDATG